MNIDRSAPVLVTGGSGYIASWVVKQLLDDGVDVHATVRDPSDESKTGHLRRLAESAPGTLHLFRADLLDAGSFDEAMAGCELVIHTASPFLLSGVKDPQRELVDPAVTGTRNALDSVNRTPSVKRVVLTSSVVSIYGDAADLPAGQEVFTEDDWNTTSSLDHQPYPYSKVLAERAAWEIAEAQDRWDLVVINPGFVIGPSLTSASSSASFSTMKQIVDGTMRMGAPPIELGVVDVRDVAQAHIRAGFTPTAHGRHICVSRSATFLELGQALRKEFGSRYPFPKRELPKPLVWLVAPTAGVTRRYVARNAGYPLTFDNRRAREDLGVEFRPIETSVVEHFQQLIDDGVVRDRRS